VNTRYASEGENPQKKGFNGLSKRSLFSPIVVSRCRCSRRLYPPRSFVQFSDSVSQFLVRSLDPRTDVQNPRVLCSTGNVPEGVSKTYLFHDDRVESGEKSQKVRNVHLVSARSFRGFHDHKDLHCGGKQRAVAFLTDKRYLERTNVWGSFPLIPLTVLHNDPF